MTDYEGWELTNENFRILARFLAEDETGGMTKITTDIEVEKDKYLAKEITLTGSGSSTIPVFNYHICAVKATLPIDITKTSEYDITDSKFFYIRHDALATTSGDQITITGTQDAGVETKVRVLLIKEA